MWPCPRSSASGSVEPSTVTFCQDPSDMFSTFWAEAPTPWNCWPLGLKEKASTWSRGIALALSLPLLVQSGSKVPCLISFRTCASKAKGLAALSRLYTKAIFIELAWYPSTNLSSNEAPLFAKKERHVHLHEWLVIFEALLTRSPNNSCIQSFASCVLRGRRVGSSMLSGAGIKGNFDKSSIFKTLLAWVHWKPQLSSQKAVQSLQGVHSYHLQKLPWLNYIEQATPMQKFTTTQKWSEKPTSPTLVWGVRAHRHSVFDVLKVLTVSSKTSQQIKTQT